MTREQRLALQPPGERPSIRYSIHLVGTARGVFFPVSFSPVSAVKLRRIASLVQLRGSLRAIFPASRQSNGIREVVGKLILALRQLDSVARMRRRCVPIRTHCGPSRGVAVARHPLSGCANVGLADVSPDPRRPQRCVGVDQDDAQGMTFRLRGSVELGDRAGDRSRLRPLPLSCTGVGQRIAVPSSPGSSPYALPRRGICEPQSNCTMRSKALVNAAGLMGFRLRRPSMIVSASSPLPSWNPRGPPIDRGDVQS